MKLLLTGASGRIGRAIAQRLAPDYTVIGLDSVPSPYTQVVGDVGDLALLTQLFEQDIAAVVHTAALHAPHVGQVDDAAFTRTNVAATLQLHQLATAAGVRRFVFTSTTALYGTAVEAALATTPARAAWLTEASLPQPRTTYHQTKLQAEQALEAATLGAAPLLRILRVARCFPEPAPWMAVYRLHRGIDVRDVADAHALALQDAAWPVARFIVSGRSPFLPEDSLDLALDAAAVLRRRAPALVAEFNRRGWPLPARIDRVYDSRAAAAAWGWSARHGPEQVWQALDAGSSEVLTA